MQKETIQLKNKELAISALRVIEKDNILGGLKEKAKSIQKETNSDATKNEELVNLLTRNITKSNMNWEEFELRFTTVNQSFYTVLNQRFPGLTPSELKLIALIKLNLSSKEIASLMSVSAESVKTFRYRLRKKLNIEKNVGLVEFINSID